MHQVIVSKESFDSTLATDIINSNISFLNVLKEENYEGDFCHEAEISYYVDYYLAQVSNGGFSQFVFNSGWNDELNALLIEGLEKMQAGEHAAFFKKQVDFVNHYDELKLAHFLNSDYFGKNPTRDELNNDEFFSIKENLSQLNAAWLRSLPNLSVLSIEEMFQTIDQLVGREVSRT